MIKSSSRKRPNKSMPFIVITLFMLLHLFVMFLFKFVCVWHAKKKKRVSKKNDLMKVQFVFNLSTCRLCVDDQSIHAIMIAKSFLFEELRVIVK